MAAGWTDGNGHDAWVRFDAAGGRSELGGWSDWHKFYQDDPQSGFTWTT
eukprot:gene7295-24083_t